jgi:hypothetical protein
VVEHIAECLSATHPAWRNRSILPPEIVGGGTYARFERSVRASGDVLLGRICELSRSFLPVLLHPFVAEVPAGLVAPPWRPLLARVLGAVCETPTPAPGA